jgi:methanogenic corrinoid protein MtbC1
MSESAALISIARRYLDALLRTDRHAAEREIEQALAAGHALEAIYVDVLAASQHEVGALWQRAEISVAQEHYCTAVSQSIMAGLNTRLFGPPRAGPSLLAACVEGNQHEFGLRMLADVFEMRGWNTVYLGASLPCEQLVEAAAAAAPDVVALSASMELQLPGLERLVQALRANASTRRTPILVGGHAFDHDSELWRRTGADGHARDALRAVAAAQAAAGVPC